MAGSRSGYSVQTAPADFGFLPPCWSSAFRRASRAAMQSLEDARRLAQSLVERGIAAGASAADALYIGDRSSSVQVRLGELEDVSRSEGEQIGLRLFDSQRSATVA